MDHLNTHKLELFVLGAPEISGEKAQIERHLLECHGCRDLADEIRDFYQDLAEEIDNPSLVASEITTSLSKFTHSLAANDESFGDPLPSPRRTATSRFTYFIRKYPIRATVGSFGLAAALTALLLWPTKKDDNPAHCNYIPGSAMVEVLNKKYERLWQFKVGKIDESMDFEKLVQIVDMNGDGVNEVLSSVSIRNVDSVRGGVFTIYSGKGEEIKRKVFTEEVRYLSTQYSPYFMPGAFVVLKNPTSGIPEIFLLATNDGRSPAMLIRMTVNGDIIGTYWHFGHLVAISAKDLMGDGKSELILTGTNDVEDETQGEFPVLVVLDPMKITGEKKSATCPGFRMENSDAELNYVGLPNSILDSLFRVAGIAVGIEVENDTTIRVKVKLGYEGEGRLYMEYYFSHNMTLEAVKSNDRTDAFRKRLVDAGKLSPKLNENFIGMLKNGVRYWDGRGWKSTPIRVAYSENTPTAPP